MIMSLNPVDMMFWFCKLKIACLINFYNSYDKILKYLLITIPLAKCHWEDFHLKTRNVKYFFDIWSKCDLFFPCSVLTSEKIVKLLYCLTCHPGSKCDCTEKKFWIGSTETHLNILKKVLSYYLVGVSLVLKKAFQGFFSLQLLLSSYGYSCSVQINHGFGSICSKF